MVLAAMAAVGLLIGLIFGGGDDEERTPGLAQQSNAVASVPPISAGPTAPTAVSGETTSVPTNDEGEPAPETLDVPLEAGWEAAIPVAEQVIATLNNSEGAANATPASWVETIRPLTTEAGLASLYDPSGDPDEGTATYDTMHERGWNVATTTENCTVVGDTGGAANGRMTLICESSVTTVDAAGTPVPENELPPLWPYSDSHGGSQMLSMANQNGTWLFDSFVYNAG